MSEIILIVALFAWLALAGVSYRLICEDAPRDSLLALFFFCLLLAPFVAAAEITHRRLSRRKGEAE